jgi:chromate transport protein ChrA
LRASTHSFWPAILLFFLFLKIGSVSVGGAYTIWAMVDQDFHQKAPMAQLAPLTTETLSFFMQVAHLTPGPNISGVLLIGDHYLGYGGIFLVFIALLLPSILSIIFLYRINKRLVLKSWFQAFKKGAMAAVIGILLFFVFQLTSHMPRDNWIFSIFFLCQVGLALYLVRIRRVNGVLVAFLCGFLSWGFFSFVQ